mmetsp:Transcript_105836/g.268917  ORF Transcript_105836/g.268917 Transcript_105836/m.268917 type:complete len:230 (-) Transcript_105836:311-1000(-)
MAHEEVLVLLQHLGVQQPQQRLEAVSEDHCGGARQEVVVHQREVLHQLFHGDHVVPLRAPPRLRRKKEVAAGLALLLCGAWAIATILGWQKHHRIVLKCNPRRNRAVAHHHEGDGWLNGSQHLLGYRGLHLRAEQGTFTHGGWIVAPIVTPAWESPRCVQLVLVRGKVRSMGLDHGLLHSAVLGRVARHHLGPVVLVAGVLLESRVTRCRHVDPCQTLRDRPIQVVVAP